MALVTQTMELTGIKQQPGLVALVAEAAALGGPAELLAQPVRAVVAGVALAALPVHVHPALRPM